MAKVLKKTSQNFTQKHSTLLRIFAVGFLFLCATSSAGALYILETKQSVFDEVIVETNISEAETLEVPEVEAFPIGVNPNKQLITENDTVDTFFKTHLSATAKKGSKVSWVQTHILSKLAKLDWYQNLASPISRILVIDSGERKEEVTDNLGDIPT